MNSATKETHMMLLNQFHRQMEQINRNNDNQYKNIKVMFGDMKTMAKNYNGIAQNYDTSIDGVVSKLLENKITLARLTTQIDFILTNMANNPDFLKDMGIWEDFVEHEEVFNQVEQELDGNTNEAEALQHQQPRCTTQNKTESRKKHPNRNTKTVKQQPNSNQEATTGMVQQETHLISIPQPRQDKPR